MDSPRISEPTNLPPVDSPSCCRLTTWAEPAELEVDFGCPKIKASFTGHYQRVTLPHICDFFCLKDFIQENFDRNHLEDRRYQIYQRVLYVLKGLTFFIYGRYSSSKRKTTTIFEIEIRPVEVASSGTVSLHFHGISYSAKRKFPCNELMGVAGRLVLWTPPVQSIHRRCPRGASPIRGKDLVAMKILQWGCWAHLM